MTTTIKHNTTETQESTSKNKGKGLDEITVKAKTLFSYLVQQTYLLSMTYRWWTGHMKRGKSTWISKFEKVEFVYDKDGDVAIALPYVHQVIRYNSIHFLGRVATILMMETCYDLKNGDPTMLPKVLEKYHRIMIDKYWINAEGLHQFLEVELDLMEWAHLHELKYSWIVQSEFSIRSSPVSDYNISRVRLTIEEAEKIAASCNTPRGKKIKALLAHGDDSSLLDTLLTPPLHVINSL